MAYYYKRRRRRGPRKKCKEDVTFDYKNVSQLRQYIDDHGKILPRRKTRLCAKHQRRLATAIKRARHLALLPYTTDHIRQFGENGG